MLTNSEQLKNYTHAVHIQFEQKLIPLIKSVSTRSEYADLLKLFYSFYAPMEKRLSMVNGIEILSNGIQLRKSTSLKEDITALSTTVENLPLCSNLPKCNDLSSAFGVMYVLEGSVLGGKTIANMITKNLPADGALPFSFFLHYGDDARLMWSQFKTRLDSIKNLSKPDILLAATDTFLVFQDWIDKSAHLFASFVKQRTDQINS